MYVYEEYVSFCLPKSMRCMSISLCSLMSLSLSFSSFFLFFSLRVQNEGHLCLLIRLDLPLDRLSLKQELLGVYAGVCVAC